MVFADAIHRRLPYGSIGRHTLKGRCSSALALLGSVPCAHRFGTSAVALVPRLPAFHTNLLRAPS